jgi:hypothetical protein
MQRTPDADGDLVCDDKDNCPKAKNANQENHNLLAEKEWGNGIELGDACDPAPVPFPVLKETKFKASVAQPQIIEVGPGSSKFVQLIATGQKGRAIQNDATLVPILADGSALKGSLAKPRFCDCRDANLQPFADPFTCKGTKHRCFLDPRQAGVDWHEVGAGDADLSKQRTAWHVITSSVKPLVKGAHYPIDYPGSPVSRHWNYLADYDFWVNVAKWMAPAKIDLDFPSGTDLGGGLWGQPIGRAIASGQPPPTTSEPPAPRALVVLPEGTGFALHAQVVLPDGTVDLAKIESFGSEVVAELSRFLVDPAKRGEIAAVYARSANSLFVVHGADQASPPLPPRVLERAAPSPIEPVKPWRLRNASLSGTFRPATRAVFSARDWRIWSFDRASEQAKKKNEPWRLRRIDPLTGAVETALPISPLKHFHTIWLTTWEDGRVVLVANRRTGDPWKPGTGDVEDDDKKHNGKDGKKTNKDKDEKDGKNLVSAAWTHGNPGRAASRKQGDLQWD